MDSRDIEKWRVKLDSYANVEEVDFRSQPNTLSR